MTTQGRRGGSRRRRSGDTAALAPTTAIDTSAAVDTAAAIDPAAAHLSDESAELLDDTAVAISGGRRGGSLRRSMPGAIVGTLLIVGVAFGAAGPGGSLHQKESKTKHDVTAAGGEYTKLGDGETDIDGSKDEGYGAEPGATDMRDATDKADGTSTQPDGDKPDGTEPDGGETGDKPDGTEPDGGETGDQPDATDKPAPEPTKKPEPKPEPTKKPERKPDPAPAEHIALAIGIKQFHPILEWASCGGLDFDYYKVVRSKDSTVSWPAGDGDSLVAAVERGGDRRAWDGDAPHGKKVWYRVFCVRKIDAGYKVVNSSAAKGIEVPGEPAPPEPITLGLESDLDGDGKVVLSWSACEVDGFAFYKVVKSTWNEDPSYLPWTEGTEIVGVVEGVHDTELHDWAPDPGVTVWYRVQCLGYVVDHKVLLGESAVVAVTAP